MLTQLGNKSEMPASPDLATIECADWDHNSKVVARFQIPEFTSRCPITSQPDFARIVIDYIPDRKIIESKSLKLFLGAFREHGAFHEQVIAYIADRLFLASNPVWLRVVGLFYPRGGISIDVFSELGKFPEDMRYPPIPFTDLTGR